MMDGFKNTLLNQQVATGVLNHVIEKVLVCFDLMRHDCALKAVKIPNNEISIRDYLFCNYLDNDTIMRDIGLDDFIFIPEVPENYVKSKPIGRADLQVFSAERFRHRKSYFIIECKRIDGNLTLNREYISEGMRRFIGESPKYTSFYKANCMMGFLVKTMDVSKNVGCINQLLKDDYSDIQVRKYLYAGVIPHTYISTHGEKEDDFITLIHVFADCTSIIA